MCFALFFTADAGDVSEEVSESAAEDVAFVCWHPQRFLSGVCESVAGEAEVLEHGGNLKPILASNTTKSSSKTSYTHCPVADNQSPVRESVLIEFLDSASSLSETSHNLDI